MDGKNSSGRRISLLNENEEAPNTVRLPSIPPSLRSRTSSYASSSVGSPQTPQLVRSDSSDSAAMQTPSPTTPDFSFEGLPPSQHMASPVFSSRSAFFPPQKEPTSAYPPPPATLRGMQRSTLGRKTRSARSATRHSHARTIWSSIEEPIRAAEMQQKAPKIGPKSSSNRSSSRSGGLNPFPCSQQCPHSLH